MPDERTPTPNADQLEQFRTLSVETLDELEHAEKLLRQKMLSVVDPGQKAELRADAAEIAADEERVFARLLGLEANRNTISPPNPADVEQVKALTQQLAAMTAAAATVNQVIDAATKLFKLWSDMA